MKPIHARPRIAGDAPNTAEQAKAYLMQARGIDLILAGEDDPRVIAAWLQVVEEIRCNIRLVEEPKCAALLKTYYLQGETMERAAEKLSYAVRSIYIIQKQALIEFCKVCMILQ